ncbi:hypothetical protein E4P24_16775 [Haloferax sp. AS1]|nr:hypothetical protein [Haloferax sp. AS1]
MSVLHRCPFIRTCPANGLWDGASNSSPESSSKVSRLNIQYNLLEAEGTSRDREYSLVDSAAASPMQ